MAQVVTVSTGDAWASNAPFSIATNSGPQAPTLVISRAYYDASVEVVSIRFRDSEVKYVIEGTGNFAIFADEHGIWGIDLEVKRWVNNQGEVIDVFRRIKVDVYGNTT
ncbi:hypothetical protein [Vulcanisaeta sp. JCM 14467]|uniref:hypothetical protein n=1 Tax=Vulcanisaeta sp. JCM 14467 TaxID=1295370 RepID=UPI0006D1F83C|nr:hypothetical protein [Vulcanisaeta sp. JCM 14467]